ncbi:MAG: tyrosine--tRNA ligase [Candidatus Omnitrophica bacterium]|nr:tyrosine--tRNA ligase [Candidatus Omnitrophota bacterium]
MKPLKEQLDIIKRGVSEIIPEDEIVKKLKRSIKENKPLVVKAGFDPSAADIHLGHTVLLRKMKHFQDLGHDVVFLIGDFTGRIGDPTGKSEIRKRLTKEEVEKNAQTYATQIFQILDRNKTRVVFNSSWCEKLSIEGLLDITSKYTVARMLERDDFAKRYKEDKPISILEFMYPLLQGYDSVVLRADIELGGTDQKFNLLVGRNLQRDYGFDPQVILTMPILEGLDGVQKMSKSLNNYVGINEPPNEMFGKIMSLSDELMIRYYELLTDKPLDVISKDISSGVLHPKKAKQDLACIIVSDYYGKEKAEEALKEFEHVFSKGKEPLDMPVIEVSEGSLDAMTFIQKTGLIDSNAEIKRMIAQSAVTIDGERVKNINSIVTISSNGSVVKIGKRRFAKVIKKA